MLYSFYYDHWHLLMTHGDTNRPRTCTDILDDESLLNIFYHCRPPVLLVEGDGNCIDLLGGGWEPKYWWYKLAWVCHRWRRLILASPSYLGISLVCTSGTPVAAMLARSPPFPLIIDHLPSNQYINAQEHKDHVTLLLSQPSAAQALPLPSLGLQ